MNASDIISVIGKVTKEWTKRRKAEERGRSRSSRIYVYSDRTDFTDVAGDILPAGYAHASGDGKFTVEKRQFYYAVRDEFLEQTGREITADYFSQNLLVKYMNRHHQETANRKIAASPRGTLTIPNTGYDLRIPCGTIAIEEHLANRAGVDIPWEDIEARIDEKTAKGEVAVAEEIIDELRAFRDLYDIAIHVEWPSLAEGQRYQGVLYIEKEGFEPQLREAKIGERFDLATISCKGQSVTAARMFVDHVCRAFGGVPLFVWRDLDKAGFEISQRLTTISDYARENDLVKYEFKNKINVIDLGLRLEHVQKYGLKSESCRFKGSFPRDTIATEEEQEFLRSNRRVELNAFTAPQFIECLVTELTKHLPTRLIPSDHVLENAYRRALAVAEINQAIKSVRETAIARAMSAPVPRSLRRQLQKALKDSPHAWDKALYDMAKKSKAF